MPDFRSTSEVGALQRFVISLGGSTGLTQRRVRKLCTLLFVAVGLLCWNFSRYTDDAYFGDDTWEYQSMAVNFVYGHGATFGGVEPFATYKFSSTDHPSGDMGVFMAAGKNGGRATFYRVLGYPLFLGAIYEIVGVHPAVAKRIQLLLLIAIAAFLPWLGFVFWNNAGAVGGLIAAPLFLRLYGWQAQFLLTECLIAFSLFVWVIVFVACLQYSKRMPMLIVGVVTALTVLVKGSNIFIVGFALLAVLAPALGREKWKHPALRALWLALGFVLTLGTYSGYVTSRVGHFVFVSTQGAMVLLDGNNEFATGGWAAGWRRNADAFFNKPEIARLPPLQRVVALYRQSPEKLPQLLWRKINAGFGAFYHLKIFLFLLMAGQLATTEVIRKRMSTRFAIPIALTCSLPALWLDITPLLLIAGLVTIYAALQRRMSFLREALPSPLLVLFGNFVVVTVVFFGEPRFVGVISWAFVLAAATLAVLLLARAVESASLMPDEPA